MNDVGRQFERAVTNAGLVDFHFHDLRHTAATRMADAGAAILGHSDIRMIARYTHATDEAKRRAVEMLVAPASVETRPLPQAVLTRAGETPAVPVSTLPVNIPVNGEDHKVMDARSRKKAATKRSLFKVLLR